LKARPTSVVVLPSVAVLLATTGAFEFPAVLVVAVLLQAVKNAAKIENIKIVPKLNIFLIFPLLVIFLF
jgi:hypothetical protein